MAILIQLISAFMLGLIGGAIPGPILTCSFAEALRRGFGKSLRLIFLATIAENIVIVFILTLFFSIYIPKIVFYVISLFGAGVLVWLAYQVWKIKELGGDDQIFSFKTIFLTAIFNGPFWIFWITISVPQVFLLKEKLGGGAIFFFVTLFDLGWIFATATLTFIFSRFRPILVKGNFTPAIFKIFALILIFFAIKLAVESAVFLSNKL